MALAHGQELSSLYSPRYSGRYGLHHGKAMSIGTRWLFLGSHNYTKASRLNAELVVQLRGPCQALNQYVTSFEELWNASRPCDLTTAQRLIP